MRITETKAADKICCIMDTSTDSKIQIEVPHLATQNLSVSYGNHRVLRDVSLSFRKNRITALIGPSGCGKSSFLQCLNRMHETVPGCTIDGSICFDGKMIFDKDIDPVVLRLRVGMIFQKPTPFPLSIARNIALGLREHTGLNRSEIDERVHASLEKVGLLDEVADRLNTSAYTLSGGQQQRLCLARALALEPDVLLLDEPCSALDPLSTAKIEKLLETLKKTTTVVMVTHNLAQAKRIADDVAMFWTQDGEGQLIEYGPTEKIFQRPSNNITRNYVEGLNG